MRYSVFTQNDKPLGEADTMQGVMDIGAKYIGTSETKMVYAIDSAPTVRYPVEIMRRESGPGRLAWVADAWPHQDHAPGFLTARRIHENDET